jgi:hypothetical protein
LEIGLKACENCGIEHERPRSHYCSRSCSNAAYRTASPDAVRAAVRRANAARYKVDPAFRAQRAVDTKKWRGKARRRMAGGKRVKSAGRMGPYRSRMEARLVPPLLSRGGRYEPLFLRYPSRRVRGYTPDVVLFNGIALEIKGWFTAADRTKLLDVKAAYPALDLRMVLASPQQKIGRQSKTTQAMWCEQHGIPWSDNAVPDAWLAEPTNEASKAVLDAAPKHKSAKPCSTMQLEISNG